MPSVPDPHVVQSEVDVLTDSRIRLSGGGLLEAFTIDHEARVDAAGDDLVSIGHYETERGLLAIDLGHGRGGDHGATDSCWGKMIDADAGSDGRRAFGKKLGKRRHGGLFAERNNARGAEHGHISGSERNRRVGIRDDQRDRGRGAFRDHLDEHRSMSMGAALRTARSLCVGRSS